jgi:hypothetical protein
VVQEKGEAVAVPDGSGGGRRGSSAHRHRRDAQGRGSSSALRRLARGASAALVMTMALMAPAATLAAEHLSGYGQIPKRPGQTPGRLEPKRSQPGPHGGVDPAAVPPSAAFVWFPTSPQPGEPVTLASISTDLASPIVAFGWDLTDFGEFVKGGPTISTTFTTPGSHVVRLRVTSADGLSRIAAETIQMSPAHASVMHPFPIVRIVGRDFTYGTVITQLAVEAPSQAAVVVECRGGGCPVKSVVRAVPASRRGVQWVTFRRYELLLRPGAALRIRVWRGTEVGAYTRFTIRRGHLPVRVDSCLNSAGITPIVCPA